MVATATLCLNSKKTERVMTMRNRGNIWKGALGVLLALWATSCTNEWEEQQSGLLLKEGEVALQWLPANMGVHKVKTRGTDPKTADEQKISNIHIFIFDADGDYLTPDGADATQFYRFVPTGQNTVLNTTLFGDQEAAESATVVVLANMPKDIFKDENNDGRPDDIGSYGDFNNFVYNLPAFTTALPDEGLPMYGVKTGVNLSSNAPASGKVVLVQLKSLMSRIDLDFTMDPYPTPETGSPYPTLRFDEVYVNHFPNGGTLFPQLNDETVTETEDKNGAIKLLSGETQVTEGIENFTGRVMNANGSLTLSLYMFEHARLAKDFDYPDGIESEEYGYQRYKNQRAKDDAAYIKLTGIYTNHNGYKYKIVYTIYPGGNATDDFTIKANRQYKHNISVRGITANNHGEEAMLDTRVDIDTEDNPYFIEMLREREHDAHFNVTPMDVYIYAGGTVTVEILAGEDGRIPDWIRMEPIGRAAEFAGDGKRKYFTTSLMDELRNDNEGTKYVVDSKQEVGDTYTLYEERIYFYIDENVPTERQANRDEDVPGRDATIRITWTRDGLPQPSYSRTVPIHQAGMRAVPVDADNNGRYDDYTIYMEEYEEYLEHYDGKDFYTHTYDGLEWGFMNVVTGLGDINGGEYLPYGWRNTMTIMQKFRGQSPEAEREMTLNEKPRGATEYCYNKNKRNPQTNRVDKCNWFHPTIRELEHMLDRYYGNYEVFQNRWYWSSNPGNYGELNGGRTDANFITWTGEHPDYARATKANYQGTNPDGSEKFDHATSEANKPYAKLPNGDWDTPYDPDWWNQNSSGGWWSDPYPAYGDIQEDGTIGGYAKRNQVFRIRAAYIPDSQIDRGEPSVDNSDYYQ